MVNPAEILPGTIFYSYLATQRKEKVGFWAHHTLVLLVSGQLTLETAAQTAVMKRGDMMLIRKNQLATLTKTPLPDQDYESIVISLQEDLLRQIALEEKLEAGDKYIGLPNILIPSDDFLQGYFQSITPYARRTATVGTFTAEMGMLKVKEGIKLLLHSMPQLRDFLFDFSDLHKIDLERFMQSNYRYNIPVEKFAALTGRSLASFKRDFQKAFNMSPRQWLLEKRLEEAYHLIQDRHKKPSAIYLDLGFESLSHFSHAFKKKFGKAPNAAASSLTK